MEKEGRDRVVAILEPMNDRPYREKGHGLIGMSRFVIFTLLALSGMVHAGSGMLDYASGWYPAGTNLIVTAIPADVYSRFDRWDWSGPSNLVSIVSTQLTLSVESPGTVTGHFVDATTASNAVPYHWLHIVNTNWITSTDFESAATNDVDGDGFTTAQEYWSGTDPFSNASYLHVAGVEYVGGNVRLLWNHDRVDTNIPPLRVQFSTNLQNPNWNDAPANTNSPVNGVNAWEEPYSGLRFYRLIVPSEP